ncbi:MAG: hypothetical protein QOF18_692 [Frankiaceae bacterium]|nr:hypothetical protein [Frankiaceae bacterium]
MTAAFAVAARAGTVALLLAPLAACSSTGPAAAGPGRTSMPPSGSASSSAPNVPAVTRVHARAVAQLPVGVSRTVALRRGSRLVVLGGLAPGDVTTSRILAFDLATRRTTTVGSLHEAVHDASGALLNGRAIVFGGGAAQEVSDVQAWSAGTSQVVGSLPTGRSDSASAVVNGTAYVVGGFDGSGLTRDILATRDGQSFRVVGRLPLGVRYPAVAAAGGFVWVIGGQLATTVSTSAGAQTDDIQRFDPRTGRTSVVAHLPNSLGHAMAFSLAGQLFVAGGRHLTTASARIWRIDARTGRASGAGRLPFAYSDAATVVVGATVMLIGGETSGPLAPIRTIVQLTLR